MSTHVDTTLQSTTVPITLRVPNISDAPALLTVLSDPRNTEFDPNAGKGDKPPTLAGIESAIVKMRSSASVPQPDRVNLVVVDTSDPLDHRVVGLGGFGHIGTEDGGGDGEGEGEGKRRKRVGDVGVMLNPDARGKSYAVEAMKLSIEFGFGSLALDEVTATMLERNEAMRGLMDNKLGWKGLRREGEFGGEYFYSMKRDDWLRREPEERIR